VKTLKINKLFLTGKIGIEGKTRQNAENKQTFGLIRLTGIIKIERISRFSSQGFELGNSRICLPSIVLSIFLPFSWFSSFS